MARNTPREGPAAPKDVRASSAEESKEADQAGRAAEADRVVEAMEADEAMQVLQAGTAAEAMQGNESLEANRVVEAMESGEAVQEAEAREGVEALEANRVVEAMEAGETLEAEVAREARDAAREAVEQGTDVHDKVYRLTLQALKNRRFDPQGLGDVVRSVTEGVALGAEARRGDIGQALAEGFRGIDQALLKSAEAGSAALRQLASSSKEFSDREFKQALTTMRRLEEDFLSTVEKVADAASDRVSPELRKVLSAARHGGTDTGRQVAQTTAEFAQRFAAASLDMTIAGLEAASRFGARFAQVAGGILAGVADALGTPERKEEEGYKKDS